MGGKGSGRLSPTNKILKSFAPKAEIKQAIAPDMYLPNHSGDHSAGTTKTPSNDLDLANKQYVDNQIAGVSFNLNDLDDVDTTGVVKNDFLQYTGSGWADYDLFNSTKNTWAGKQTFNGGFVVADDIYISIGNGSLGAGDAYILYDSTNTKVSFGKTIAGTLTSWTFEGNIPVIMEDDLEVQGELKGCRSLLGGGDNSNLSSSLYLKGFNGQRFTATKAWDMMRAGSVTGCSLTGNASIVTTAGDIILEIRNQAGSVLMSKTITISATGDFKGSTTQARNTQTFSIDDVISLYVNFDTFVGTINDLQGLAEIVTDT